MIRENNRNFYEHIIYLRYRKHFEISLALYQDRTIATIICRTNYNMRNTNVYCMNRTVKRLVNFQSPRAKSKETKSQTKKSCSLYVLQ